MMFCEQPHVHPSLSDTLWGLPTLFGDCRTVRREHKHFAHVALLVTYLFIRMASMQFVSHIPLLRQDICRSDGLDRHSISDWKLFC